MISLENVSAGYDGRTVLRDLTTVLRPGSFHFLTGPSGVGKSTFLRLLSLEMQPTGGTLKMYNQDVTRIDVQRAAQLRRNIGIVLQDSPMLNHLSVWHNVAVPLYVAGKRTSDISEDVTEMLQWVGLGDLAYAPPDTLSVGERQRVGIARAVIGKPALILADEPTSAVDPRIARRILRLFIELNRLGTTVIIATHDNQFMQQFKAPRLTIDRGRIKSE